MKTVNSLLAMAILGTILVLLYRHGDRLFNVFVSQIEQHAKDAKPKANEPAEQDLQPVADKPNLLPPLAAVREPSKRSIKTFSGFAPKHTTIFTEPFAVGDDWSFDYNYRGGFQVFMDNLSTKESWYPDSFGMLDSRGGMHFVRGGKIQFKLVGSGAWKIDIFQHDKRINR